MKFNKFALLSFTSLISASVFAIEVPEVKITNLQTYTDGSVSFTTDKTIVSPVAGCSTNKYLVEDNTGRGAVLSMLLAAKMGDKKLSIRVSDTVCTYNNPVVDRITFN
jgi:hypothetical protein